MTFYLQQPGEKQLLDAIDKCAKDALSGGGVFAFASKGGVDTLFGIANIQKMLENQQPFQLIVGIDAITNSETLLHIEELATKYGNEVLKAYVFLHELAPNIFHPKFLWFKSKVGVSHITGSGNLTERGLGKKSSSKVVNGNWEAFSVESPAGTEGEVALDVIECWISAQLADGKLLPLNDQRVIDKAVANARIRYNTSATTKAAVVPVVPVAVAKLEESAQHKFTPDTMSLEDSNDSLDVLVRELPKNRSGQGDVGRKALNEFFGHDGEDKFIYMQYVELNNSVRGARRVWLFLNDASNNYRLELPESKNDYEIGSNDERMILIAVKLGSRSYRYTILRPIQDKKDYEKVWSIFPRVKSKRRLMDESFTSTDALRAAWEDAPANLLPLQIPAFEP